MPTFPSTVIEDLTFLDGVAPYSVNPEFNKEGKVFKFNEGSCAMVKEAFIMASITGGNNNAWERELEIKFQESKDGSTSWDTVPGKVYTLRTWDPYPLDPSYPKNQSNYVLIMSLKDTELSIDEDTGERYYWRIRAKATAATYGQGLSVACFGGRARLNPHAGWDFSPTENDTAAVDQQGALLANSIK